MVSQPSHDNEKFQAVLTEYLLTDPGPSFLTSHFLFWVKSKIFFISTLGLE